MTPAARVAAAAAILDQIIAGSAAEPALITWARGARYAGSKDRAAIRDLVFDALRAKRSLAARGGAMSGRGLMVGLMRAQRADLEQIFSGEGHALAPVGPEDTERAPIAGAESNDWPDWLWPQLQTSLGSDLDAASAALQQRGPVFLRVNLSRGDRDSAIAALANDAITATPHPEVATALVVVENARKVSQSRAFLDGLVEVQDAASQAAVARLPLGSGRVLDYCAGGGGKSLALADRGAVVTAHDIDPRRMADIPARADRAGVQIKTSKNPTGSFDLVFCDAPCSGSGTWRRTPDAKWRLTPDRLEELSRIQLEILEKTHKLVGQSGHLAYATCSILDVENRAVVDRFLESHPDWALVDEMRLTPSTLWDGFYLAILRRFGN